MRLFPLVFSALWLGTACAWSQTPESPAKEMRSDKMRSDLSGSEALHSEPWVRRAVIYEVYLRSFSQDGKLFALEDKLEDLKGLGVNCIWLMPVQPIGLEKRKGSMGSPYAVKDYYGVNLEYGTKDLFKAFVKAAHEAEMKVIIDWVADHTAWDNAWVKSKPDWYKKDAAGKIVSPNEFWEDTAGLDYRNRDMRSEMIKAMAFWVKEYDIDGFRCDVADLMPSDFWAAVRKELLMVKPSILMLAEGTAPEDHLHGFDLTYAEDLYKTMVSIVRGEADASFIDAVLESENKTFPKRSMHFLFTENHDLERAAKVFGPAHYPMAVLLFTLSGVPMLYNGQEIGELHRPSLFEKEVIDWKDNSGDAAQVKRFYKKLINFRKGHLSFISGQRFKVNTSDDRHIYAFACSYRGDAALIAVNLTPAAFEGTMELPEIFINDKGGLKIKALFPPGNEITPTQSSSVKLNLPAWGYQIWEAK